MKRSTFLRAAPLLLAGSCATTTANQPTRTSLTVGSHTQTADQPHPTNNYWFATGDGSVVIDAHWRLSTARTVLEKMRAAGLSTPRYLILTHDHTDHYGGSPVLRRAGAAVLASPLTRLSIKNDAYGFQRGRRELFGEDFPATPPVVDRTVNDGEALRVGNYTLRFHDRPANEATTTTLVEVENTDALFVGDFVYDWFYDNRFAVASWEPWLTFDGISAGKEITQPVFIVHSEKGAVPQGAKAFYDQLRGDKNIKWLNQYTQQDLYFQPEAVTAAMDAVGDYLKATVRGVK